MQLKAIPADFIVEEESILPEQSNGPFHYFRLTKTNYDWYKVQNLLCKVFSCSPKDIGIAGIKDKNAITTQIISIRTRKPFAVQRFKHKDIQLEYLHAGSEPIKRGFLKGNRFTLVVRGVHKKPLYRDWFINYFDDQRFSKNNITIGLCLLKQEYEAACELLKNETLTEFLGKRPRDYVGALKKLPYSLLTFYAHAVQSAIFNEYVSSLLDGPTIETSIGSFHVPLKRPKDFSAPLVGFETDIDEHLQALLQRYGIKQQCFVNRQLPALTCEGGVRDAVVDVEDLQIGNLEPDELGDAQKITLSFTLPKGCYATMFIKQLFV
ncbi:tRNA pseudouridine(13) synthase TruD [Candidatus Woesearchaeota archaeon]|nr:MAG: tRNA pseudouridine(13) synthase TruD [Candidatus Woesearchaeota archaeon]